MSKCICEDCKNKIICKFVDEVKELHSKIDVVEKSKDCPVIIPSLQCKSYKVNNGFDFEKPYPYM